MNNDLNNYIQSLQPISMPQTNPYSGIQSGLEGIGLADKQSPTKRDFKTDVDVAPNVGAEKLQKGPYNPYNRAIIPAQVLDSGVRKPIPAEILDSNENSFNKELMRNPVK